MITLPSLCGRFARLTLKLLALLLLNSVLITNVACSSRSSSIANNKTNPGTADEGFAGGDNTTPTTKTTKTAPADNKLFDTDLDDKEAPANATLSNFNRPSSTEQSCLANGFNNYGGEFDDEDERVRRAANPSTARSNACLSPQQTGARVPLSQNTLYDAGVNTYSTMNNCLEMVLARGPRSAQEARRAHVAGRMALVRCYREQVLGGMRDNLPWGNDALQSFQVQDNNLRVLLRQLSQYCQNGNCNF